MSGEGFRYPVSGAEASPGPTPYQTVGPFFHYALPYAAGPFVAGPERTGAIIVSGTVFDGAGAAIPDALVEIWQADDNGDLVTGPGIFEHLDGGGFRGFGRCATDTDGSYSFRTVKPGAVGTADGRVQAPYIAMSVFARGMLRRVITRVYFADEVAANAADPLLSGLPEDRRATLVATRDGNWYRFDVRLQGADETVFLDVHAG